LKKATRSTTGASKKKAVRQRASAIREKRVKADKRSKVNKDSRDNQDALQWRSKA